MNQTEGILSFSINLPEMKIGIGFFYLRKENGGGSDKCYCQSADIADW